MGPKILRKLSLYVSETISKLKSAENIMRVKQLKKLGKKYAACILLIVVSITSSTVFAARLKDIASVAVVRDNPLIGYGLVVGLDGTGDQTTQTPFTTQSFRSMMKQFDVAFPDGQKFQLKNVSAVTIHAVLPPFSKPGQPIDVTVSSIGNSKSIRGGSLLMSSLKGADGQVYAIAQGELVVGGFGVEGSDSSKVTVNIPLSLIHI